jgi:hypothetical protein
VSDAVKSSTKLGEKKATSYHCLLSKPHIQQRSVFHAPNPRQIHALLCLQETLTEPCELVISQLQALSWNESQRNTPVRLCVVIKLHPARGFDITDPSTPQPRPRLGLPVPGEKIRRRRCSRSTCAKHAKQAKVHRCSLPGRQSINPGPRCGCLRRPVRSTAAACPSFVLHSHSQSPYAGGGGKIRCHLDNCCSQCLRYRNVIAHSAVPRVSRSFTNAH